MTEEPLYEIEPRAEVEIQVDAFFAPLYQLIPPQHHELIAHVERHMISAVKSALRLPATEPVPPDSTDGRAAVQARDLWSSCRLRNSESCERF